MSDLKFYTTDEVATMFQVSRRTVLAWVRDNKITGRRPGGKTWIFTEEQIRDFVDRDANDPGVEET